MPSATLYDIKNVPKNVNGMQFTTNKQGHLTYSPVHSLFIFDLKYLETLQGTGHWNYRMVKWQFRLIANGNRSDIYWFFERSAVCASLVRKLRTKMNVIENLNSVAKHRPIGFGGRLLVVPLTVFFLTSLKRICSLFKDSIFWWKHNDQSSMSFRLLNLSSSLFFRLPRGSTIRHVVVLRTDWKM